MYCGCGERGIRTLGSAEAEQRFSRPPRSATPASLLRVAKVNFFHVIPNESHYGKYLIFTAGECIHKKTFSLSVSMNRKTIFRNSIFGLILLLSSCSGHKPPTTSSFVHSWKEWQKNRIERLKSENGWLNLAGLYWLQQGNNTFGSDSSCDLIFPTSAPPVAGKFIRKDTLVTLEVNPGAGIVSDGKQIRKVVLESDASGHPTVLKMGTLVFFLIKRDTLLGIRLRDLNSPLSASLDSIPCYPPDSIWKIKARFLPFDKPEKLYVPTVIGTREEYTVPGKLVFEIGGQKQILLPFSEGKGFFIIFGDGTSALETYGAGRFLQADEPDSTGTVVLDFNRAYNPPCAFTPYATCPLPPKENLLTIKITAGEKDPHIYAH